MFINWHRKRSCTGPFFICQLWACSMWRPDLCSHVRSHSSHSSPFPLVAGSAAALITVCVCVSILLYVQTYKDTHSQTPGQRWTVTNKLIRKNCKGQIRMCDMCEGVWLDRETDILTQPRAGGTGMSEFRVGAGVRSGWKERDRHEC